MAYRKRNSDECKETLTEDGLTAEEMEEELAIIVAQKAFCLQKLGRKEEALTLYNGLQKYAANESVANPFWPIKGGRQQREGRGVQQPPECGG